MAMKLDKKARIGFHVGAVTAGLFLALIISTAANSPATASSAQADPTPHEISLSSDRPTSHQSENKVVIVAPDPSCIIKGAVTPAGKVYQIPGCAFYNKTNITTSRGERWFCNEAEAQEAGWRKATSCP